MKLLKILGVLIIISSALGVSYFLFHKETYTVAFNTSGGSKLENLKLQEGEILKAPDEPTKEGFTFAGWYVFDTPYIFNKEITSDLVLTAKWSKKEEKTYTIEFDSLNDELILPIKVSEGEILKNIPKPLKDGYIFQGWYFLNNKFNFENPIHKNMVLVASWEKLTE